MINAALDLRFVQDTGFCESCHAGVTGECGAQQQNGDCRTRRFTEPHLKIHERQETEFPEQRTMGGFGRDGTGDAVVESICAQFLEGCSGGRGDKSVEDDWHLLPAGGKCRAEDRSELASAESRGRGQWNSADRGGRGGWVGDGSTLGSA